MTASVRDYIVGCDPGFAHLGLVVCERLTDDKLSVIHGVVAVTEPTGRGFVKDCLQRIQVLTTLVTEVLTSTCNISYLVIEAFSPPRNSGTAFRIGFGYGMVVGAATAEDIPIVAIRPQAVRKALGYESKLEAIRWAETTYPEIKTLAAWKKKSTREHLADALAVAHVAVSQGRLP